MLFIFLLLLIPILGRSKTDAFAEGGGKLNAVGKARLSRYRFDGNIGILQKTLGYRHPLLDERLMQRYSGMLFKYAIEIKGVVPELCGNGIVGHMLIVIASYILRRTANYVGYPL